MNDRDPNQLRDPLLVEASDMLDKIERLLAAGRSACPEKAAAFGQRKPELLARLRSRGQRRGHRGH